MADIQTADPSIYKGEPSRGMSLADMLNISRSALAYQKEKELYEPSVAQAKAQSKLAEIQATGAEQKMPLEVQSAQTQLNTQQLDNLVKHSNTTIQAIQKLSIKPDLTSEDIVKEATELNKIQGGTPQSLQSVLQSLPQNATPTQLKAWLAQKQAQTLNSLSQLEKVYPGGILPGQLPTVSTEEKPKQAFSEISKLEIPHPVRKAGEPYLPNPSEAEDRAKGEAYRSSLINRQTQLTTARRNIDEVIKTAKEIERAATLPETGPIGSIKRKIAEFTGDPTYQQLSKDLANAQLQNMQSLGMPVNTNEGMALQAAASGNVTYSPDVLQKIARRTQADMTNIDLQGTAAQKFYQKYGDNNMAAFRQKWNENADSKIFEVINIAKNPDLSKEEKQKMTSELLGSDSETRKEFNKKYQTLIKMTQGQF